MRRTYRKKKYKPDKTAFTANHRIKAFEVRVIDQDGNMLGVMNTKEALKQAQEAGMDLVEVNPKADPPIAKFADFGKIQYEKEKQKQKAKAKIKKVDTKGVRLSFKISEHDREVRVKQSAKFLSKGDKVKIELTMRGRENKYAKQAVDMVNKFITDLNERIEQNIEIETHPKKEANKITAIITLKQ